MNETKFPVKQKLFLIAMMIGSGVGGYMGGQQSVTTTETNKKTVAVTEVDLGELAPDQDISALSIPKNTVLTGSFDSNGTLNLEMKVKFNRNGDAMHETWKVAPAASKLMLTVPETSMLKTAIPVKTDQAAIKVGDNESKK